MRKIPPFSTGVRLLNTLRWCTIAGSDTNRTENQHIPVGASLSVLECVV